MFHKPICKWSINDNVTHDLGVKLRLITLPTEVVFEARDSYLFFSKVVQSVWDDRNKYETILSLFGGWHARSPKSYPPPLLVDTPPLEHPTKPAVDIDIEYVQGVVNANSFAYAESRGRALYALVSLCNHSCLPSAHKTFVGDAILVRASQDMKKGEEVTLHYILPSEPYDERRFRLMRSWKFKCTCVVCEADSQDDVDARLKRRAMTKELDQIMNTMIRTMDREVLKRMAKDVKRLCDDMKATYNRSRSDSTGGVKFELAAGVRIHAAVIERLGRVTSDPSLLKQTIELRMNCLDFSGIKVTDRSMLGALPKQKGTLPIDTSRVSALEQATTILMMLQMVKSFDECGQKMRAQRWLDATVHRTSFGLPRFAMILWLNGFLNSREPS